MKKWQMHQGGSALIYALVAGILVIVLASGLYLARQYEATSTEVASNNSSDSEGTNDSSSDSSGQSSEDKDNSVSPTEGSKDEQQQDNASKADSQSDTTVNELPATGPSRQIGQLLAVSVLTFAAVSYVMSRRLRWTSREK